MGKKIIGLFEIATLVVASFSFAFIVGESNDIFESFNLGRTDEGKLVNYLRFKALNYLSKGLVSAQSSSNPTALYTCIQNVNGTICQEYPNTICDNVCSTSCIPTSSENTVECQIGTCFDPVMGLCSDGSPKFACENSGGVWSEDVPAQCNRNCCLINPSGNGGDQAQYTTQQQCNYLSETLGAPTSFDPTITNELECLALANSGVEGACVLEFLPAENAYNCEFTTQSSCDANGGSFYEGKLCTANDLMIEGNVIETICERTLNGEIQTSCSEQEDGVYFVDSCGNFANIYDSTKINDAQYWNEVVSKNQSCNLGTSSNAFLNQKSCGNCNYLGGSICGEPIPGKDEEADFGDLVCRDLRCVDYLGEVRQNGESWCRFDSRIGVDSSDSLQNPTSGNNFNTNASQLIAPTFNSGGNGERDSSARSVDVPGSRHYKEVCFDGEVRLEPCQDFRNEVCVESEHEESGYTSAQCRINLWEQCMQANEDQQSLNECEENTDCFLKNVAVDEYFEFDVCVPRHPPGFDLSLSNGGQVGEEICSAASQTCTYVEQKGFDGWSCVANCDCKTAEFTEEMNNLCISLGDCGGYINLAGEYTDDGYSEVHSDPVRSGYISGLNKYKDPVLGQKVEPLSLEELTALLGIPNSPEGGPATIGEVAGWVLGLGGLGMAASLIIHQLIVAGTLSVTTTTAATGFAGVVNSILRTSFGTTTTTTTTLSSAGAWANWAGAAAVGAAIGFILAQVLGLQGDAVLVVTLGGAAGGVVSFALGAELFATNFFLGIGIGIGAALVAVFLFDLGETRKRHVDFTCRPWQPPTGGDNCDLCNEDDLGCSAYKCQSLGQNCELVNPGTDDALCVDINPNDVEAPDIDKWDDAISEGFEYTNSQINVGTEIESSSGDGCIKEYTPVEFGLELNEPGQCKWDTEHTSSYEEMSNFFGPNGGSSLYKTNHDTLMALPALSDLGVTGVDPSRRGNYDLYLRCQDSSGNSRYSEYNVRFCVAPQDDVQPPTIIEFSPESPGQVALGIETLDLQFYTDEPADCKWSLQDQAYELMENDAVCNNGINQVTTAPSGRNGWSCLTQLDIPENSTTTDYFFRCADQPWLGQNSTGPVQGRNVNTQSKLYQVELSQTPLEINFVEPNDTIIYAGSEPVTVDLELHTVGGIDNTAMCEWSFNGNNYYSFFPTGGQVHNFHFNQLTAGNYNIALMCTDSAQNVANSEAIFDIVIDNQGPAITRVYDSGGTLNIITNEESACSYDFNSCGFTFSEGTLMTGLNYHHTTSFDPEMTYRIKCQDVFGNVGQCLTVSGGY